MLQRFAREEPERIGRAVKRGITEGADRLKARVQIDTAAALGPRMANTWKREAYPRAGPSPSAAALVYSKAPDIIDAFAKGVPIRGKAGNLLAVPTANVIRQQGLEANPASFEEAGIPLRFVPINRGRLVGFLVADNFRVGFSSTIVPGQPTRNRRILRAGRGRETVVMFFLYRTVKPPKLFDLDQRATEAADETQRRIQTYLGTEP